MENFYKIAVEMTIINSCQHCISKKGTISDHESSLCNKSRSCKNEQYGF